MFFDDIEEKIYRGKPIECFYEGCGGIFECESYDDVQKTVYGTFTHVFFDKETGLAIGEESIDAHMHIDDLAHSAHSWGYKFVWHDHLDYHIGKGTVIQLDDVYFTCKSFDGLKVHGIITDINGSSENAEVELIEIEKRVIPYSLFCKGIDGHEHIPYTIMLIWDYEVNNKTEDVIGCRTLCDTEIESIRQYLKKIGGKNRWIESISENTDKFIGEINSYSEKKEISKETKNDIIKNEETEF